MLQVRGLAGRESPAGVARIVCRGWKYIEDVEVSSLNPSRRRRSASLDASLAAGKIAGEGDNRAGLFGDCRVHRLVDVDFRASGHDDPPCRVISDGAKT